MKHIIQRPVERKNHAHVISHEKTNTINPNKASHIISHLTNNDKIHKTT